MSEQMKLLSVDKVKPDLALVLNVSLKFGITCLNNSDFDRDSSLYHIGFFGESDRSKRIEKAKEGVEKFKEDYNCEKVKFVLVDKPFSDEPLKENGLRKIVWFNSLDEAIAFQIKEEDSEGKRQG